MGKPIPLLSFFYFAVLISQKALIRIACQLIFELGRLKVIEILIELIMQEICLITGTRSVDLVDGLRCNIQQGEQ